MKKKENKMTNERRATYTALSDVHNAMEGYPPERWAHDAKVAVCDYLIYAKSISNEEIRILMQASQILKQKANNG
jgi:hypothetical protein